MNVGAMVLERIPYAARSSRERLAHAFERPFRGAVKRSVRATDMPHLRTDVDQAPTHALCDHSPDGRLGDEKRRLHIKAEHRVIVCLGHIVHRHRTIGARIVNEDIEGRTAIEKGSDSGEIGNVEHSRLRCATCSSDRLRTGFDLVARPRNEYHPGAGLRQGGSERQADTAPGSRHQCAPTVQPEARRPREFHVIQPRSGARPYLRRARRDARNGARGYWPARRAPRSPPARKDASNIHRSSRTPHRSARAGMCRS